MVAFKKKKKKDYMGKKSPSQKVNNNKKNVFTTHITEFIPLIYKKLLTIQTKDIKTIEKQEKDIIRRFTGGKNTNSP